MSAQQDWWVPKSKGSIWARAAADQSRKKRAAAEFERFLDESLQTNRKHILQSLLTIKKTIFQCQLVRLSMR
jgi:hypothetical protein